MTSKPTREELLAHIKKLEKESIKRKRYEKINQTLFKISNAINITSNLSELYDSIHQALSTILDTTNFFIAIYDQDSDSVKFPYCVDQVDGCLPPIEEGFTKTASLTAEVVRTGKAILMVKDEIVAYRNECGFPTPNCTPSSIWLGAPLRNKEQIIGVIAVQSYTNEKLYDETDKDVLVAIADQVALAISRKTAEEMLIKNQEKYIDLYDNAPDFYASIGAEKGEIIDCNQTLCDSLGYQKNEIIGRAIFDIYTPDSAEYAKKKVFPKFQKYGVVKDEEFQLQRKDGSKIDISLNVSAIRDPDGKPIYSRSIFRDITERKQVEAQREKLLQDLKNTLSQVKILSGLLPICSSCKKIRDDKGYWNQLESYIRDHSEVDFSHSICPECSDKLYGDEDWYQELKKNQEI